jgi:hypothetical protein
VQEGLNCRQLMEMLKEEHEEKEKDKKANGVGKN